jgi:hypothetical protein
LSSRRLGLRRPRVAGLHPPAGLIEKAAGRTSGPTTLPGGATIPAGSQVTDATSMLGALQARTAMGVNGSTPLPRDQQFWALMGPGAPLYPAPLNVPNTLTGQADPRRWQYPVSWNLTPDAGRLVDWSTLRAAARDVDLIAQCIRVRRTEQSSLEWDITLSRRTIESNGLQSTEDKNALLQKHAEEISRLIEFWGSPDKTNDFSWPEWLEMLIQEMLVTDAVAIYPRFTYGGDLASLELIDGASVKPLLDERGNRPRPPAAAYQQWLYGFPRGEYTSTDGENPDWEGTAGALIYKPRFTQVASPYGYSPVEQALVSAELWLRRQQWMVAEYKEGTTPRTFLKSNLAAYTPEQIRAWEDSLNDFYSGSTGNRHRLKLLPEGFDPSIAEDAAERYKPDYDEFLVKLLCAHLDVQPQEIGFTPRNGLGGAGHGESQEAITYRKALRPTAQWLASLMNQISYAYLGMSRDLTFQFLGLESEDELQADQVLERQYRSGRRTLNECRDEHGLSRYDFPEADMPMLVTERGLVVLENSSQTAPPGELITPMQAAPMQPAPEGGNTDTAPPPRDPRQQTAPPPTEPGPDKQSAAATPSTQDVKKAELAAYWRWARKNNGRRTRPFEFAHMTKTDARLNEVDLTHVTFKAGDAGPKAPDGQTWPAWEIDQETARHWAREISRAFGGIDTGRLAQRWTDARKSVDSESWLEGQGVSLTGALRQVLQGLYGDGYVIGIHSARYAVDHARDPSVRWTTDWGGWSPGDRDAAKQIAGPGLQRLLQQTDITIRSVAAHRMRELGDVLAEGLDHGLGSEEIARSLRGVLTDPGWAYGVAVTETNRAVTYASHQTYAANGVDRTDWIAAAGACPLCQRNVDAGPVRLGSSFPSGATGPPGHPHCRCATAPHIESITDIL